MSQDLLPDTDVGRLVQPLWDYLAVTETPRTADVIFVFGSRDLAVPERAAELYHEGHAPRVLATDSYGRMTRGIFPKPEALVFQDHLIEAGVPPSAILTEPAATNTLENVRLGIETLRRAGRMPASALLVAKGFVMRRCVRPFHNNLTAFECGPVLRRGVSQPRSTAASLSSRHDSLPNSSGWSVMRREAISALRRFR